MLTSLDVLPGVGFIETTGSRLAHGGVTEVKSHLKQLEEAGGGVYFIDEAYQLAEGHNVGLNLSLLLQNFPTTETGIRQQRPKAAGTFSLGHKEKQFVFLRRRFLSSLKEA